MLMQSFSPSYKAILPFLLMILMAPWKKQRRLQLLIRKQHALQLLDFNPQMQDAYLGMLRYTKCLHLTHYPLVPLKFGKVMFLSMSSIKVARPQTSNRGQGCCCCILYPSANKTQAHKPRRFLYCYKFTV